MLVRYSLEDATEAKAKKTADRLEKSMVGIKNELETEV